MNRNCKHIGTPFFMIPGTFQSILSPRFDSLGYTSPIRYNPPSEDHLAYPLNHPFLYEHPPFKHPYFKTRE